MWSAGVILLTLLARRFPFFNSADDIDAMIEMASIFGSRRMKAAAALHGQIFETTIPTIGEKGYSFEKLVKWASCVEELTEAELQATDLLAGLMELDPTKRLSAKKRLCSIRSLRVLKTMMISVGVGLRAQSPLLERTRRLRVKMMR